MASGTWFPPPVRGVEIPKSGGGTRMLGVPTVADKVAQTVVATRIEAEVEPLLHEDSYGYRPGKSALDAVGAARRRCGERNWVIDLDVAKFFDSVPWDEVLAAVERHAPEPWVLLYVRRWLAAPVMMPDGSLAERDRGTPQGLPSVPCWLTCSYAMRSTRGSPGSSRTALSRDTPMTRSCTAVLRHAPGRSWPRWRSGWDRWACGCIRIRPGSSTPRTPARTASGTGRRPSTSRAARSALAR